MECVLELTAPSFVCTGSNESHIWKELHGSLLDKFNCGTCQLHADKRFRFEHDHVNAGLGKGVWDSGLYEEGVKETNEVYDLWVKRGRPLRGDSPNNLLIE